MPMEPLKMKQKFRKFFFLNSGTHNQRLQALKRFFYCSATIFRLLKVLKKFCNFFDLLILRHSSILVNFLYIISVLHPYSGFDVATRRASDFPYSVSHRDCCTCNGYKKSRCKFAAKIGRHVVRTTPWGTGPNFRRN